MTPNQLYALPPSSTKRDPWSLHKHLPQIDFERIKVDTLPMVELRYYAEHCADGERTWTLFSVWFCGFPFMICQEAGRGGQDHTEQFVTHRKLYNEVVSYLFSLYEPPLQDQPAECPPDMEIPYLDNFYGNRLSNFYDPTVQPKFKVGDIVKARVLIDHLHANSDTAEQRIQISNIRPYSVRGLYFGKRLDWRWGDRRKGEDPYTMVFEKDRGSVWCDFNNDDVIEVLEHAEEEKLDGA